MIKTKYKVKFSPGNSKMGRIVSVSLPSVITCRLCGCRIKCYARKLERLRPNVREAYLHNLKVLQEDPETFWREVNSQIAMCRFFRFHVSGDIPDADYLAHMIRAAKDHPACEILCFTKKYELVNEFIARYGMPPKNLHLLFSGWPGLTMDNPYGLPEAHVLFRNGVTTASHDAKPCGGNCTECATTDSGCWTLKYGEQVVFHEH